MKIINKYNEIVATMSVINQKTAVVKISKTSEEINYCYSPQYGGSEAALNGILKNFACNPHFNGRGDELGLKLTK